MLNDLETSVFGGKNELGDDSPSFYQQASHAQLHNFFRPTSTITTQPVKSLEISESGSSTSCIVSAPSNSCSIGFRLDYCPWHTYESKSSWVCTHVCWHKYKYVFQFSQNPVHGMPSFLTANTDNDHQAPKVKWRRAFILDSEDKE